MPQIVKGRWFAFADLALVVASGVLIMFVPRIGAWLVLLALLPWGIRLAAGQPAFRRTSLDWLTAVFVLTALAGYWAAYDRTAAWSKLWLLMAAALLYYALAAQPKENLSLVCVLVFGLGVGVSLHYFLTYDFVAAPRKLELVNRIGRWLMEVRPSTGWNPIHPNYVAGLAAITAPFILYPLFGRKSHKTGMLQWLFAAAGLIIVSAALLMTTSRGVFMAILSGVGIWLLWRFANLAGVQHRHNVVFPALVLVYLCAVVAFLYLGPAGWGSVTPGNYQFGNGSRAELFSRSLYLLGDYPITGGGLGSFPGLYSRYLLGIPYYNVPNSHNLFMDAGIEQGIAGGLAYLAIFAAAIWILSRSLKRDSDAAEVCFGWIALFSIVAAFVHGMVDDYLYNGRGAILCLIPAALAVLAVQTSESARPAAFRVNRRAAGLVLLVLALLFITIPKKILSVWYADLGSVSMSRVELEQFPNGGWPGPEIVTQMSAAEAALKTSLQLDPSNRTANQRLGLISMLRQDFSPAARHLEAAYREAPGHRGIIKSLGFCYIWLGDLPAAGAQLSGIPETSEELDAYIWYWGTMGRDDLAERASIFLLKLESMPSP